MMIEDIIENFDELSKKYDYYLEHGVNLKNLGIPFYMTRPKIVWVSSDVDEFDQTCVGIQCDKSMGNEGVFEWLGDGYTEVMLEIDEPFYSDIIAVNKGEKIYEW